MTQSLRDNLNAWSGLLLRSHLRLDLDDLRARAGARPSLLLTRRGHWVRRWDRDGRHGELPSQWKRLALENHENEATAGAEGKNTISDSRTSWKRVKDILDEGRV